MIVDGLNIKKREQYDVRQATRSLAKLLQNYVRRRLVSTGSHLDKQSSANSSFERHLKLSAAPHTDDDPYMSPILEFDY